jgi:hypothetical protein
MANYCRQMAEHTADPELKKQWLFLTGEWMSMISEGDGTRTRPKPDIEPSTGQQEVASAG